MATGIASAGANTALDAIRTDTPFIQLHVADPGAAGTTSVTTETTRKAVTFSAASAGSQDATHFTIWNAASAGTFKFSGTITANAYTAGDTFTISTGSLTLTVTPAS